MTKNQKIVKAFLAGSTIYQLWQSPTLNPNFKGQRPCKCLSEFDIENIIRKAMIRRGKKRAR